MILSISVIQTEGRLKEDCSRRGKTSSLHPMEFLPFSRLSRLKTIQTSGSRPSSLGDSVRCYVTDNHGFFFVEKQRENANRCPSSSPFFRGRSRFVFERFKNVEDTRGIGRVRKRSGLVPARSTTHAVQEVVGPVRPEGPFPLHLFGQPVPSIPSSR